MQQRGGDKSNDTNKTKGNGMSDKYEYIGCDFWSRALFSRERDGRTFVDCDGYLHTISDYEEPISSIGVKTPEYEE